MEILHNLVNRSGGDLLTILKSLRRPACRDLGDHKIMLSAVAGPVTSTG
jgi:hypothetical protein